MFEELLKIAKTGRVFTKEEITEFNKLSSEQKQKIFNALNKAKEDAVNEQINNEFKRVYKRLLKEEPETAAFLASIAKINTSTEEEMTEKYRSNKNYSVNEVLIAIYWDPETPENLKKIVKEKVYQKNAGLVFYAVKRFSTNDGKMTMDDLGQDCKEIFLTKVFNTYSLAKGFRFSTYCVTVMNNYLKSYHTNKLNKQRAKEVSMDDPIVDDGGSVKIRLDYQIDNKPTPEEYCRKESEDEILYDCLNKLTLEQKFIAYCRYGLGNVPVKTQAEIADYMHMSQANVSKIEGIMRTKLHQLLNARHMF